MKSARRRIVLLTAIMSAVVLGVEATTVALLYRAAFHEETDRLVESASSQARLIEAVARFNRIHGNADLEDPREATLLQVRDAHSLYSGFGQTGEFTLSQREGDQIVFLVSHRHEDLDDPRPVPWTSELAEPMRRALSGESGTVVGLDYRGETVLAAYEPVAELDLGIVAKIDLTEVRAPFVRAGLLSGLVAVVSILLGSAVFVRVTHPLLKRLQETVENLERTLGEVKTLRGILPICSFCKKIRDDDGYWDQVEVYVTEHSEADFSHGVCPDCMKRHYPDFVDEHGSVKDPADGKAE